MNIFIVGAGRMGMRHATGVAEITSVKNIHLMDVSENALINAQQQLSTSTHKEKFTFSLVKDAPVNLHQVDILIIASTANDRISSLQQYLKWNPNYLLIEKPLGQSIEEVKELIDITGRTSTKTFVNLNMRLYDSFLQLKQDLHQKPQLKGKKVITVNTGSIGIGANGIHYIDLLYFLLEADHAEIVSAEIDEETIQSGRGPQFQDFGGWAVIKFYDRKNHQKGTAHLSLSATSTAFGSWEIIAPHGRITLNELAQTRVDHIRKEDSTLPFNRYAADYLPIQETAIASPFLGELTRKWVEGLIEGKYLLPDLKESLKAHELLFNWLAYSKTHQKVFPIT